MALAPDVAQTVLSVADPVTQRYAQLAGNRAGAAAVDTRGLTATYRSAIIGMTLPATPTIVGVLVGAANVLIRPRRIRVFGAAAVASQIIPVGIAKLSSAPTGGTNSTPAVVPDASGDAAGSGVLRAYTVLPTGGGTVIGTIDAQPVTFALATAALGNPGAAFDFTNLGDKGPVLTTAAECLAVHLQGVTLANATTISMAFEWTEEASSS